MSVAKTSTKGSAALLASKLVNPLNPTSETNNSLPSPSVKLTLYWAKTEFDSTWFPVITLLSLLEIVTTISVPVARSVPVKTITGCPLTKPRASLAVASNVRLTTSLIVAEPLLSAFSISTASVIPSLSLSKSKTSTIPSPSVSRASKLRKSTSLALLSRFANELKGSSIPALESNPLADWRNTPSSRPSLSVSTLRRLNPDSTLSDKPSLSLSLSSWSTTPSPSVSTKALNSPPNTPTGESKASSMPSLSASTPWTSWNNVVAVDSTKSTIPSLSESISMKLAIPSPSVSCAIVPPATASATPSLSESVNTAPLIIPSRSASSIATSAPLSSTSLMPSLSLSRSRRSRTPSPSVSRSAGTIIWILRSPCAAIAPVSAAPSTWTLIPATPPPISITTRSKENISSGEVTTSVPTSFAKADVNSPVVWPPFTSPTLNVNVIFSSWAAVSLSTSPPIKTSSLVKVILSPIFKPSSGIVTVCTPPATAPLTSIIPESMPFSVVSKIPSLSSSKSRLSSTPSLSVSGSITSWKSKTPSESMSFVLSNESASPSESESVSWKSKAPSESLSFVVSSESAIPSESLSVDLKSTSIPSLSLSVNAVIVSPWEVTKSTFKASSMPSLSISPTSVTLEFPDSKASDKPSESLSVSWKSASPSPSVSTGSLNVLKPLEPNAAEPSNTFKTPSESSSPDAKLINGVVGWPSFKSEIVSLSESRSILSAKPSLSESMATVPILLVKSPSSNTSTKPSESVSTPSEVLINPSLFASAAIPLASPLSTKSLIPSLSESRSKWSLTPSLSVSCAISIANCQPSEVLEPSGLPSSSLNSRTILVKGVPSVLKNRIVPSTEPPPTPSSCSCASEASDVERSLSSISRPPLTSTLLPLTILTISKSIPWVWENAKLNWSMLLKWKNTSETFPPVKSNVSVSSPSLSGSSVIWSISPLLKRMFVSVNSVPVWILNVELSIRSVPLSKIILAGTIVDVAVTWTPFGVEPVRTESFALLPVKVTTSKPSALSVMPSLSSSRSNIFATLSLSVSKNISKLRKSSSLLSASLFASTTEGSIVTSPSWFVKEAFNVSSIPSLSTSEFAKTRPVSSRSLKPSLSVSVSIKSNVPSPSVSSGVVNVPPRTPFESSLSTFTVKPSLSASVLSTGVNPELVWPSIKSAIPSLSESRSIKLASPSLSVSNGAWPPLSTELIASLSIKSTTSARPSLSLSRLLSTIPSLFWSITFALAPDSTKSLIPSLSESKSRLSITPSPSVSKLLSVKENTLRPRPRPDPPALPASVPVTPNAKVVDVLSPKISVSWLLGLVVATLISSVKLSSATPLGPLVSISPKFVNVESGPVPAPVTVETSKSISSRSAPSIAECSPWTLTTSLKSSPGVESTSTKVTPRLFNSNGFTGSALEKNSIVKTAKSFKLGLNGVSWILNESVS